MRLAKTVKKRNDDDDFEEFFEAFRGKEKSTGVSNATMKKPKTNEGEKESRTTQKSVNPKTGPQSVIELGYGPISMEYDANNPKGLWDKVRKGEVSEIYIGDAAGSTFVKNPTKPWDYTTGSAKAMENGRTVFANPNAKKEDDDTQFLEFLKGFGGESMFDRKKKKTAGDYATRSDGLTKKGGRGGHF